MRAFGTVLVALAALGCGEVVTVKTPASGNPNGSYTCTPEGEHGFACQSRYSFHQYDREVTVSKQQCAYGVSQIHVETNWRGKVTRIQYTCALLQSGDFPSEDEGKPCPPSIPH